MKVIHRIFSANLETLDKATWLGIVWNYILEEAIKKSWETQMFGKSCSRNLSKIHSESWQASKVEIFAEIVNYQKPLTIFVKSSSLDVWQGSEDASDS